MASDVDKAVLAFMFDEIATDAEKAIENWQPTVNAPERDGYVHVTEPRWNDLLERVGRIGRLAATARDALRG